MTVAQLLRSMSSRELGEWLAIFKLEREPAEADGEAGLRKVFGGRGPDNGR